MKPFYKTDWFLRIISLVIAIILWIYISYEQKPQYETWIRGVDVVQTNLSQDFENGKLVIMEGATDKVDVKVRGDRKDVSAVNQNNIVAIIDMLGVKSEGVYSLPISITVPMDGIEIVQKSPSHATIKVDKIVTVEKRITVDTKGTPAQGLVMGDMVIEPESVKLTGPESVINTVSSARVTVDLAQASQNPESLFKIKLYDVNDNEIINSLITHNIEYVQVHDLFAETKMVDVIVDIGEGVNENGEKLEYTILSSTMVQLTADSDVLNLLENITTEPIDVSAISEETESVTKLILPEGVKLVNEADADVKVKIYKSTSNE